MPRPTFLELPMQKPFDVTTIMENVDEALVQETYDAAGTRPRNSSSIGGKIDWPDSKMPPPRPSDDQPIAPAEDAINASHYRRHPSGIECIEVTRHMNFNTGNAIKYIWRYCYKGDPIENLKKAQWYIDDEIRRLEGKR